MLLYSRLEASKCPDIVVAKNVNIEKYKLKQTPQYFDNMLENKVNPEFLPLIEWQREKCAEFSNLRLKISRERNEFKKVHPFDKSIRFVK